jgi:hypothetical protein
MAKLKRPNAAAIAAMEAAADAARDWLLIQITSSGGGKNSLSTVMFKGAREECERFADRIPTDVAQTLAIIPHQAWDNWEQIVGRKLVTNSKPDAAVQ